MIAAFRETHSSNQLTWCECRQPLGVVLHSSDESHELSHRLCRDDSTINIVQVNSTISI